MMRGPVVAGPRPSRGDAAQFKNAHIKNVSRRTYHGSRELLARLASGLVQRRLTHRNPELRLPSIELTGSTDSGLSLDDDQPSQVDPKPPFPGYTDLPATVSAYAKVLRRELHAATGFH